MRPRRRDTTSTSAPAAFRARSGTTSSTFSKPSAARAAILRPLSRRPALRTPSSWLRELRRARTRDEETTVSDAAWDPAVREPAAGEPAARPSDVPSTVDGGPELVQLLTPEG